MSETLTSRPTGAGDITELAVNGAAANWQAVSDDSDATFNRITNPTVGNTTGADTYAFSNSNLPENVFIVSMTWKMRVSADEAGFLVPIMSDGAGTDIELLDSINRFNFSAIPATDFDHLQERNEFTLQPFRREDFDTYRFGTRINANGLGGNFTDSHRFALEVVFIDLDNKTLKTIQLDPKRDVENADVHDALNPSGEVQQFLVVNTGQGADPRPSRAVKNTENLFLDYIRAQGVGIPDVFLQLMYPNVPATGDILQVRLYNRARDRPPGLVFFNAELRMGFELGGEVKLSGGEIVGNQDPREDHFNTDPFTNEPWTGTGIKGVKMAISCLILQASAFRIEVGNFYMEIDHAQGPPRVGAIPVRI